MTDGSAQASLVERIAGGDEVAIAALYEQFAGALYGYGLNRLGDHQLAEELVQDVMARIWRSAARYDPERGSVRTWMFTIARSAAVDIHRRRSRGGVVPAHVPSDGLDEIVEAEAVRAALDRLSAEHREILDLAYFSGLPQAEIARRLAIPVGTVKSRTFYALRAFRLACEELGIEP